MSVDICELKQPNSVPGAGVAACRLVVWCLLLWARVLQIRLPAAAAGDDHVVLLLVLMQHTEVNQQ